jgi:NADH:ubiquinone oxidoreductase subunit 6 (subunit J)
MSALGLAAAVLSILLPVLLTAPTSPIFVGSSLGLFPGDIFGAVISVYFFAFVGIRSVAKAIALILASTFAYGVAFLGGIFLGMAVSGFMGLSLNPENDDLTAGMIAPILIAGVLGSFVLVMAVLRLYSAENSWKRVLTRSSACSLAGGVLALVGWALGSALGGAVWSALQWMRLNASGQDVSWAARGGILNFYSVHIVWQAGMGVVLGVLLSDIPLADAPPRSLVRPARKVNLGNAVLFICMALALAWFLRRWLPDEFRESRWQRAYARHVAEKPSDDNLPQIALAPTDTMLILTPFGEYLPRHPGAGTGHYVPISGPQPQVYSVRYSPAGAPDEGPNIGPHADIRVEEWPNAAWAKWELENGNYASFYAYVEQSFQFGNRIRCTHAPNDRWGPNQSCAWTSENKIVVLEFYSVSPGGFLRMYLQKYPSSL